MSIRDNPRRPQWLASVAPATAAAPLEPNPRARGIPLRSSRLTGGACLSARWKAVRKAVSTRLESSVEILSMWGPVSRTVVLPGVDRSTRASR